MVGTRPEWSNNTNGIPIEVTARVRGNPTGSKQDVLTSRQRISLVRPGSLQPNPEDEYDVSFVYGPDAVNKDVHSRTVAPLLGKLLDGYNISVLVLGATGTGKTSTLEGTKAADGRAGGDGDGVVHLAADEIFSLLHAKASAISADVARRRRMPSTKNFDFFVEATFVEVYCEACHDLFAKHGDNTATLPVAEGALEGYHVAGASAMTAKSAAELRQAFNRGRANRRKDMMDLGSSHDRSAALFTISVAQYTPATTVGEEDRVLVSSVTFVDLPGSERLAMDPEVLRLREGADINKGLLSFASALRSLNQDPLGQFVNYRESLLMQLLADAVGGNSLTSILATIKQGEWEVSTATMKALTAAHRVRNYPIINNNRSRGLVQKLRLRFLNLTAERETLREQLDAVPADGDPSNVAINVAKVRDLEARLLDEREEKAELGREKEALALRLAALRDAGQRELAERAELQDALVHSEEARLEISRHLIDFQLECNEAKLEWEKEKHELQQHLLELEAKQLERYVRQEDHAGLQDDLDRVNHQLLVTQRELDLLQQQHSALNEKHEGARREVQRLQEALSQAQYDSSHMQTALARAREAAERNSGTLKPQ